MEYPNVKSEWRAVTPKLAKEWLEMANRNNRALRETTVTAFARDMKNGKWLATHQGIAFNAEGILEDGQHRLAAVVESGCTVEMLVTTGLPVRQGTAVTKDAIDAGAGRSVPDRLALSHGFDRREARLACAAAQCLAQICCVETAGPRNLIRKVTIEQTLAILDIFKNEVPLVIKERSKVKGLKSAQVLGAFAFALAVEQKALDILKALRTGVNLSEKDAILHLRNALMSETVHGLARSAGRQRVFVAEITLQAIWLTVFRRPALKLDTGDKGAEYFRSAQREKCQAVKSIFEMQGARTAEGNAAPLPGKPAPAGASNGSAPAVSMAKILKAAEKKFGLPDLILFRKKSNEIDVMMARRAVIECANDAGHDAAKIAYTFGWTVQEIRNQVEEMDIWREGSGNEARYREKHEGLKKALAA